MNSVSHWFEVQENGEYMADTYVCPLILTHFLQLGSTVSSALGVVFDIGA